MAAVPAVADVLEDRIDLVEAHQAAEVEANQEDSVEASPAIKDPVQAAQLQAGRPKAAKVQRSKFGEILGCKANR